MPISSVSIEHGSGVYLAYRSLPNKVWFALAEYVDNSLQSFNDNYDAIHTIESCEPLLKINIEIDEHRIRISDNAGGIDPKNFKRAFAPAILPEDTTGLNEFGMGMKIASVWLANQYTVRTSFLGEDVTRTFHFDLDEVVKNDTREVEIIESSSSQQDHFTEITLERLSPNAPSSAQVPRIKEYLSSIYRKYINEDNIDIVLNGETLRYHQPEVLNAPFYPSSDADPEGPDIFWREEFNVQFGDKSATGFIAILKQQKQGDNGFSIFRRGRVISGAGDKKYFPEALSGKSTNSYKYLRLFGEIEIEGFEVSFNKQEFQGSEELDALFKHIKNELLLTNPRLLKQADNYRVRKSSKERAKRSKKIAEKIRQREERKVIHQPIEKVALTEKKAIRKKPLRDDVRDKVVYQPIEISGTKYETTLVTMTDNRSHLYYWEEDTREANKVFVNVYLNFNHPIFDQKNGRKNQEGLIIELVRCLSLSECHCRSLGGTTQLLALRNTLNDLLKSI